MNAQDAAASVDKSARELANRIDQEYALLNYGGLGSVSRPEDGWRIRVFRTQMAKLCPEYAEALGEEHDFHDDRMFDCPQCWVQRP